MALNNCSPVAGETERSSTLFVEIIELRSRGLILAGGGQTGKRMTGAGSGFAKIVSGARGILSVPPNASPVANKKRDTKLETPIFHREPIK
jgi:hypothetical protein